MPSRLRTGKKMVGVKQSRRAIKNGEAAVVYIAKDAESRLTAPFYELCASSNTELVTVETMDELGAYCKIEVGAAVAVLLK